MQDSRYTKAELSTLWILLIIVLATWVVRQFIYQADWLAGLGAALALVLLGIVIRARLRVRHGSS